MARRASGGVLAAWAEAQRREQRRHEVEQRAWRAAQLERERAQLAAARGQARDEREAWRSYQAGRDADAAARTGQVEAQVTGLVSVLQNVLAAPPFRLEQLIRPVAVAPFNPGRLAVPVVMPDQRAYQVPPPAGILALSTTARREYQQACQRAQEQFERDCRSAWQYEEQRKQQLDAYFREYQAWADRERRKIADYNAQVEEIDRQLFDPARSALLLLGGDKSGNWQR